MNEQKIIGELGAARRRMGDFSALAEDDGLAEIITMLLVESTVGLFGLYIRRSQKTGVDEHETANYLIRQEKLLDRLLELGVPRERILLLANDTGKSAALTRAEREDLDRLFVALGEPDETKRVAVVVSIEISRLHRNPDLQEPVRFASRMSRMGTVVVTTDDRGFRLLRLRNDDDYDKYIQMAKAAAKERKSTRLRTLHARETAVSRGSWSGSATLLGWRAEGKKSKWETPEGRERPAMEYVYEPHRLIKLEIMRASLLPHINTLAQLHHHLLTDVNRYTFPPFAPEVRDEAFGNSILPRCSVRDFSVPGGSRPPYPHEPYFPSPHVLEKILIDTQAIGDVRFGSGPRNGGHILRKAQQRAERDDHKVDSLIRDYRPLARYDKTLALCRTAEEQALFWAVVKKWSPVDIAAARATNYEQEPPNPDYRQRQNGRPIGTTFEPFAFVGKLFCGRHGVDPVSGDIGLYRHISKAGEAIVCRHEQKNFSDPASCASVYGVADVLLRHFLKTIAHLITSDDGMLDRLRAERNAAKMRAEQLDAEHEAMEARQKKLSASLVAITMGLSGEDEGAAKATVDEFIATHIKPLVAEIASNRREAAAAREASLHTATSESVGEIKTELRKAVMHWESFSADRQCELVSTFVESIVIMTPPGNGTGTVVIEWRWSPRTILDTNGAPVRDILLYWKTDSRNHRPWTTDEDDALRRLWPASSGATREDIQDTLSPGRNFSSIQSRAASLKIGRGANRTTSWRTEWRFSEYTYGEKHSDVLYLHVIGWQYGAAALVRQIVRDKRERRFGPEGDWFNQIFVGKVMKDQPIIAERAVDTDTYTDAEIDLMMNGESVEYMVADKTHGGVSQLGHRYMPTLLPEEDREMMARMGQLVYWEADEKRRAQELAEDEKTGSGQPQDAIAESEYGYSESLSHTASERCGGGAGRLAAIPLRRFSGQFPPLQNDGFLPASNQ